MEDRLHQKVIIFGYGFEGVKLYRELINNDQYEVIGFADNSPYKQHKIVGKYMILSLDNLIELKDEKNFSVIIAAKKWFVIGEELEKNHICIEGIYRDGKICEYNRMCFERLDLTRKIVLYAGDIADDVHMAKSDLYGLSINQADSKHILHDITHKYPLPDNSIYSYQAEDVLEHIEFGKLVDVINEIYRILQPEGLFRICLPDYNSSHLSDISMRDKDGKIVFDPTGGGSFGVNGVENTGHVWFPNYIIVRDLLEKTKFDRIDFLCYHTESGELIKKDIDFSKGYINRLPKADEINKPVYSIIVDCYK